MQVHRQLVDTTHVIIASINDRSSSYANSLWKDCNSRWSCCNISWKVSQYFLIAKRFCIITLANMVRRRRRWLGRRPPAQLDAPHSGSRNRWLCPTGHWESTRDITEESPLFVISSSIATVIYPRIILISMISRFSPNIISLNFHVICSYLSFIHPVH